MDISAARMAMANQLIAFLPSGTQVSWFQPDEITEPAVYFRPVKIEYDRTMRHGFEQVDFEMVVLVSRADDLSAQTHLDAYLSSTSATCLKTGLEANLVKYGGPGYPGIDDLWVSGVTGYQWYVLSDQRYLGATFAVSVYSSTNGSL